MKRILKSVLFCYLLFCSFSVLSQTTLKQYENTEANRITKMQATEKAIEVFIADNIQEYRLEPAVIVEITNSAKKERISSAKRIEHLLLNAKRRELRKIYLQQHPDLIKDYTATALPAELRQACVNGDFESEMDIPVAGYTFNSASLTDDEMTGCTTPAVTGSGTTVGINIFDIPVSIMSIGPGYIQYDPTLNVPQRGNITIPTVGNGNRSIKLNVSSGNNDVTTMTRELTVNDPTFEYSFSLMLEDSGDDHDIDEKPFFRVNIIANGMVVFTRCINAVEGCIFMRSHDNRLAANDISTDILYTDWICDEINVEQFMGKKITVEFTIADCDKSGHFGTVYIDDICDTDCNLPGGSIIINPPSNDCDDAAGGLYQLCGTITPPIHSSPLQASLGISKNGGAFQEINNPVISMNGNTFCAIIPASAFGPIADGDIYQFQVMINYVQNCNTISATTSNVGSVTVEFNCSPCPPDLTLTSPNGDDVNNAANASVRQREVLNWIKATNKINFGNSNQGIGVVYTAGEFIELNPDFEAEFTSQFTAYIKPCPGTFTYRPFITASSIKPEEADLGKRFIIYPNPADNSIEIVMPKAAFKQVSIMTIGGRKVYEQSFASTRRFQADVGNFAAGIYIVIVTTEDGQRVSGKLIKN